MGGEGISGTELERVPLQGGQPKSTDEQHLQQQQEVVLEEVVLEAPGRNGTPQATTSGRAVPVINWGEKRMRSQDIAVSHCEHCQHVAVAALCLWQAASHKPGTYSMQPWKACMISHAAQGAEC